MKSILALASVFLVSVSSGALGFEGQWQTVGYVIQFRGTGPDLLNIDFLLSGESSDYNLDGQWRKSQFASADQKTYDVLKRAAISSLSSDNTLLIEEKYFSAPNQMEVYLIHKYTILSSTKMQWDRIWTSESNRYPMSDSHLLSKLDE